MDDFRQFFADDSRLFFFCALLLFLYQLFLWKNQKFYNFSPEMEQHPLNRKYNLNRRCSVDLSRINCLYAISNIVSIALSSLVLILIGFKAAMIALGVLLFAGSFGITVYCGKYYSRREKRHD